MALKGNLRDFSTTQLLNLVNLAKKTGMLTVDGHSENVILYFKEGRLIRASSDADSVHLVTMLQKTGKLAEDQAKAVNSQSGSSSDRVIGKYLMDAKLVSRDDIIQGVKEYILGIVYDLFTWVEGDFFFEQDSLPANDRITIPLNLDNVILVIETGGLRIAHWGDNRDKPDDRVMKALGGVDVLILPIDESKHILSYEQIQIIADALSPRIIIPCHYYSKGVNSVLSTLDTADEWVDQQPDPIRLTEGTLSLEQDEVKKMKVKAIYFGSNYVSE